MNLFHVILLSVVEGITEFLPISSTGHLVLLGSILHIQNSDFSKSFEILIQLGAISAVAVLYIRKILTDRNMLTKLAIAFIPTAIIGLALYKIIKHVLLGNPYIVIASLFIGGIIIIALEWKHKYTTSQDAVTAPISAKQAVLVGIAQSLSVIPGVSRSAASIIGGQLSGLSRKQAVEFSFLLAIPTMVAATALDLIKSDALRFTTTEWQYIAIGLFVSFITALVVVKFFVRFIEHHTFISFGIYRICLAIIMLIVRPF